MIIDRYLNTEHGNVQQKHTKKKFMIKKINIFLYETMWISGGTISGVHNITINKLIC